MKRDSSLSLNMKVTVHAFEGENNFSAPFCVYFAIDDDEVACLELGTTCMFPFSKTSDTFQIIVKETSTDKCLGRVTMKLDIIYKVKPQPLKHWITLFDDPSVDVYDGNYLEDDLDPPRILLSYEILKITEDNVIDPNSAISLRNEIKTSPALITGSKTGTITETRVKHEKVVVRYSVTHKSETVTKSMTNVKITEEVTDGDKTDVKTFEKTTQKNYCENDMNHKNSIHNEKELNSSKSHYEKIMIDEETETDKVNIVDMEVIENETNAMKKKMEQLIEENIKLTHEINNLGTKNRESSTKHQSEIKEYKEYKIGRAHV